MEDERLVHSGSGDVDSLELFPEQLSSPTSMQLRIGTSREELPTRQFMLPFSGWSADSIIIFTLIMETDIAHRKGEHVMKERESLDIMESKFEEFNLLIKAYDDIAGIDNIPDTIKQAILVARAPEPLRTHLQLNSQSDTTFLEVRQAINQYLKARKGFKLMERDDPMDVDFVHKQGQKGKEKGKGKSLVKKRLEERAETVARRDTYGAKIGRMAAEPRNKRTMSVRQRKTGDVTWVMMIQ